MAGRRFQFAPWLPALLFAAAVANAAEWRLAVPGWDYEFPKDHGNHPEFKTEWWYFTGNVSTAEGREFGYQLTFFRQGVQPPGEERESIRSRFVVDHVVLAHFALTDIARGKFFHRQKLRRGAFGEAGFAAGARLAWIDEWELTQAPDGGFHIRANDGGAAIDLRVSPRKPPAIHGRDGLSRKADGEGRASHYYSLTRLETSGTLTFDGSEYAVGGESWFDHEWATNQLTEKQSGWDWLSLQLDNGSEMMLFQIRLRDGGRDTHSGGSIIQRDGTVEEVGNAAFEFEPVKWWRSPQTKAEYPMRWKLRIPERAIDLEIEARVEGQELALDPIAYWEGAVAARGSWGGKPVRAKGYLEMTGYAGELVGLQAAPE